ncbi:hypothetical protein OGR47_05090 [Methylocystis sp. MJC1]|jgi:hypothetical protein|uniref:DUF5681 domain-containing protein n=1 Tax=Methylocystis sp. MJC1 TaxID=2654282 RepID=UPI0013EE27E1|nr:DUF5681 domain-containing protein [Methylocystis sp. MJC1]MBU6526385.1 hypothetical protein [Methylocystis sp. MJC1]UZX12832.1 hypothetical protein OGR47_05090 [Methylocystis sp. MJC1]
MVVDETRNNVARTRGRPFEQGNPGRPRGARNRATLAAEALLDGEAEALTRRAIELALAGDGPALRLCLERLVPARRDRPVYLALPAIETASGVSRAMAAILAAVAAGDVTPSEAEAVSKLVETHLRALEATEFERRLKALEGEGNNEPDTIHAASKARK